MTSLYKHNYIGILLHVLLWMLFGFTLLFYIPRNWGFALPYQFWIKQGTIFLLLIAVYYFNAFILVPRFLLKNRIGWFILILAGIVVLCSLIVMQTESPMEMNHRIEKVFKAQGRHHLPPGGKPRFLDPFLTLMILLVTGISTSVTSILTWQRDDKRRQLLEQEKTHSELAFLKDQINPHFFFNTLNNIYALTHVDVEISRTALHKLSRLMRYLLYDTQHNSTSLNKEIAFINDYIELMKLRLTDMVTVSFDSSSIKSNPEIAPMLLLPFIENAFKHGISVVHPASISIVLTVAGSVIHLNVCNTTFKEPLSSPEAGNGIGLTNTRRRLNLLYPGKHTLLIKEDAANNIFMVSLKLQTS